MRLASQDHTTKQVAELKLKSGDLWLLLQGFPHQFDTKKMTGILEWSFGGSVVNLQPIAEAGGDEGSSSKSYSLVFFLHADQAL